ncbi:MAG: hypothetical protein RSA22_06750 [Acinetobacter sp.]
MATNLGTLTLNLLANTGSYTQGLQRAERQTEESTENMAEGFDLVGKSVAALSGVVAGISVAGVVAFAAETINAGNQVKKLADLSNADTQQFQYYAVGAKTAGIEIEQFADQMKDMQDRIGDFQQTGGGPLADFFTNIAPLVGVTIQQFQKLSGPDAMQLFYDSLEKVFATENDIKFYMEGIISDSSKLVPLLRDGGKGFQEWGDRAKEAGAIMSNDMIKQLSDAKENLQILDLKWQGFKTTLINDAMPAFTAISKNIDTVTNVMMVGGAFMVGMYIPTIYSAATALGEKVAACFADVRATQLANEIAAQRAARLVQLTEVELNNARVQAARMTGMARLAFMERTIIPLEQQHTAAVAANTVAQNANNASKSMAARVMSGLSAVIGGPVGLGVLVASVAAGYLLLSDNTDKSTKSLNENGAAVADVVIKYQQLSDAQQRTQLRAQTKTLVELTDGYKDASNKLLSYVINIEKYGYVSAEAAEKVGELLLQYQNGKISSSELAAKINALSGVSAQAKSKIDEQTGAVKIAKDEMLKQKAVTEAMIKENQALADSHQKVAVGVNEYAVAMNKLTNEQRSYVNQVKSDIVSDKFVQDQIKNGIPRDRAEFRRDAFVGAKVDLAKPNEIPKLVKDAEMEAWALNQREKAREEAEKKAEEAAKKRQAAREKARNDAEKKAEDQAKSRDSISTDYADDFKKLGIDHAKNIAEINKANFRADQAKYLKLAQARYDHETEMYLRQVTEEINAHKWSEEYKLKYSYGTQREIVENSGRYNDEIKKLKLEALNEQEQLELDALERKNKEQILSATEAFSFESEIILKRYALERDEIIKNATLSEKVRKEKLTENDFKTFGVLDNDAAAIQSLYQNSADYMFAKNNPNQYAKYQLQNQYSADFAGLNDAYNNQLSGINQIEDAETWFTQLLDAEDNFLQAKAALNAKYAAQESDLRKAEFDGQLASSEQFFGSMTDMLKNSGAERSGIYKVMFATEKAMAIARSIMAIQTGIAEASANPFPMNLAAMASVAAATAGIIGNIQSVSGVFHGGTDYVPKESSYLLDKGERVLSPRQNTDLTRYLSNQRQSSNSGATINITNNTSSKVDARQGPNGQMYVTIDEVEQFVSNSLAQPNSRISKSVSQNTSAARRR